MKNLLAILFALALCTSARAVDLITATITITNNPAGLSSNITIQGSTRFWTNNISSAPGTLIQTTNTTAWAATNLINHLTAYPAGAGHYLSMTLETNVLVRGRVGEVMTITIAGGWASVTYSTQTVSSPTFTVRMPITIEAATNQTNIASLMTKAMSDSSTNAVATNSIFGSNFLTKGASPQQYVASPVQFAGIVRAASTGGLAATNGYTSTVTNINSVSSNHVNYGNAIRSEGSGGNSLQVGSNALALSLRSMAIGNGAVATNTDSMALGTGATATNDNTIAVGNNSRALGNSATAVGSSALAKGDGGTALGVTAVATNESVAIGIDAQALTFRSTAVGAVSFVQALYGTAVGFGAQANHSNSAAIGPPDHAGTGVATTTTNQIRLGTSVQHVSIPGALEAAVDRNLNAVGTNSVAGIFAFSVPLVVSSVAPGHNVIDSSTNTILYLTGSPGAAWTLGGFSGNKNDGRELEVWNQTGFDVTIQNESGTAPTATDRILTYATTGGTNATLTGNGLLRFRYSTTAARWLLSSPNVDVLAQGTNGINSISTNGVAVSSAATALNVIGNDNISVERATNTAGAVSIQFAPVLFRCTNFGTLYNGGEWEQLVNEEWIGDADATTSGTMGTHGWAANSSGTLPALSPPIIESNVWAYISVVTTQTTSMRTYSASYISPGFATGWTATNCEYFMHARLRMNSTNKTTDVARHIFGLYTSGVIGEPNAGIYVMNNTNVNTNTWIACTSGGGITRNYSTIATYDNMTWTDVGIYVDRTGTNAVFMYGPDRFRYTSFATNVANLPGSSSGMGPAWQVERVASVDGFNFRTNYCDFVKVWVRRFL